MSTTGSKIDAVLFDLDGTLVNSIPGIEYALQEALRLAAPESVRPLNILTHIGPPIGAMIRQMLPELAPDTDAAVEAQFRRIYDSTGWQKTRAYPRMAYTLEWLNEHGIRCFVITNKPALPSRLILEKTGLLRFFQEIVTPDVRQPAFSSKDEMAAYVLEKYQMAGVETLMIGDSADDFQAARNLNLRFLAAGYGYGHVQMRGAINFVNVIFRAVDIIDYVARENKQVNS
jgi:phosphoglycolate phosphatase